MIDRTQFFNRLRPLFSYQLRNGQVAGMSAILNEWEKQGLTDVRMLAYMLATVYHESAGTMKPVEEYGHGMHYDYGKKLKRGGGPGKRIAYTTPDQLYYGRGLVQITWYENYELMGRLLDVDLLNKPELALDMKISVEILFEGMMKENSNFGDFTGHCLEQFFNDKVDDPVGARKIINGTDKAQLIAHYHQHFLHALSR